MPRRTSSTWRPLTPLLPSPLPCDGSYLRYVEYPFPHLQEHLDKDDTIAWPQTPADDDDNDDDTDGLTLHEKASQSEGKEERTKEGSSSPSLSTHSSTSTVSSSPSSEISYFTARHAFDNKRESLNIFRSSVRSSVHFRDSRPASTLIDMPISWIQFKQDNLAALALPKIQDHHNSASRRASILTVSSPRSVDIAYFLNKTIPSPSSPKEQPWTRNRSSSSSFGSSRITVSEMDDKVDEVSNCTGETVNDVTFINELSFNQGKEQVYLSSNSRRPPSILSCHSSSASSSISGASRSLSYHMECKATALLLNRQPQSPLFYNQHKYSTNLSTPFLVPPPSPQQHHQQHHQQHLLSIHSTQSTDTIAKRSRWHKTLFKRRRPSKLVFST